MFRNFLVGCMLLGCSLANVSAQETTAKRGKVDQETAMVSQFVKQFEPAGLNQETTAKLKEIFSKTAKEVVAKRKDAKLTPEMLKNRTEATKKAREEGKKPKEVREIGLSAMNATEDQKKVLVETEEMLSKTRIEIGKLLTEEQKSKLPKQLQANLKEPVKKK
ncbi:MAG: hypothetical protein ACKOAU_19420 [Pirellula sp.]